jgi:hypothetical protein
MSAVVVEVATVTIITTTTAPPSTATTTTRRIVGATSTMTPPVVLDRSPPELEREAEPPAAESEPSVVTRADSVDATGDLDLFWKASSERSKERAWMKVGNCGRAGIMVFKML